jgi:hypothetical protein
LRTASGNARDTTPRHDARGQRNLCRFVSRLDNIASTGVKFDHIKFINDHSRAVVFPEWMEPLLLACMCPDPRSPGEGVKHSRASMRSKLNYLSGIGAAKMRVPEPQAILVHESLEALNSGRSPTSRVLDAVWETTESGAMINVLACHSQEIQRPLHGTGWPVTLSPTMVRTYGSTHAPISLLNSYREPRWLWSISALCWHVPRSPIVPSTNYRPRLN